jgi:hypothetical protein
MRPTLSKADGRSVVLLGVAIVPLATSESKEQVSEESSLWVADNYNLDYTAESIGGEEATTWGRT